MYCSCILRNCSNTLRYCSSISNIVPIFWVPFHCLRYRPSISGTVPGIEVLPLHFLKELNKTSKFSVWIDDLRATIWNRDLPDASRESYALKHYVRYEMYRRSIKVLSINCKDMNVVVTYNLGWALVYMVAVPGAEWRESGMFILGTLHSDTKMGWRNKELLYTNALFQWFGRRVERKRQTIMTTNTLGGTWTWNPSEKQTEC